MDHSSALSIASNIIAFVEYGVSLLANVGQQFQNNAERVSHTTSILDGVQLLLHQLQKSEELGAKLEEEQCLSRHPEVRPSLKDLKKTTQDFRRILRMVQSYITTATQPDRGSNGDRKLRGILQWLLPASQMLDNALNRLWLHLHLIRRGHCYKPYGTTGSAQKDNDTGMDLDTEQENADWVDLHQVPIIIVSVRS